MRVLCFALTAIALLNIVDLCNAKSEDEEICVVQDDGSTVCYDMDDDDDEDVLQLGVDDDDDGEVVNEQELRIAKLKAESEAAKRKAAEAKKEPEPPCVDNEERCAFWASSGECMANPNYMLNNCRKSCNNCANKHLFESGDRARKMEEENLLNIVKEYGVEQKVEGAKRDLTMLQIRKTIDYMKNYIYAEKPTHRLPDSIIKECTNNHELCAFWSAIGECEENVSYMQTKCAPSCQTCFSIDFDARCPKRPDDAVPGLKPGELNLMFERIVKTAPGNQTEETQLAAKEKKVQENGTPYYTVHVHSRPKSPAAEPDENGVIALDPEKDHAEKPWAITFENFVTDEECDHLIQLGYKEEYKRSKDVGRKQADGSYDAHESTSRTSENAWCSNKNKQWKCREDPIVQRVMDRISNVTGVPTPNFEDFQMLKYEEGQFYRTHHDYIEHQKDRASGPRILTFFLYLSDVEEGGGTGFNQLNGGLVVNPKKGKALLWPSVMNYDPSVKEKRTTHEAISVGKGRKFAANSWIHLYDVVETQKRGCT